VINLNKAPLNPQPLVERITGAVALLRLRLKHPTAVDAKQAAAAADEALEHLRLLDSPALQLAEALHIGTTHYPHPLTVSVGFVGREQTRLQLTVMDGPHLMICIQANTVAGLREQLAVGYVPEVAA
tara:strand:+ start:20 stop:400 length:381 start_codon:yes stop_codon:yes gene_type:complete